MINRYLKNIIYNKGPVALIMLGFIISATVIITGLNIKDGIKNKLLETSYGPIENINYTHVNFSKMKYEFIKPTLLKLSTIGAEFAEIHVGLDNGLIGTEQNKHVLIAVNYKEYPEWKLPLLSGNIISPSDIRDQKKYIMIGRNIYNKFSKQITNNSLLINGLEYKIIGVIGKKDKQTAWDDSIYLPISSLPDKFLFTQPTYNVLIKTNGTSPSKVTELIQQYASKTPNITINVSNIAVNSQYQNSIYGVLIVGGTILLVAILNLINLSSFWLYERHREFSLKMILGATKGKIILEVICELFIMTVASVSIALLPGLAFSKALVYIFDIDSIILSLSNILSTFLLLFLSTVISVIWPLKTIITPDFSRITRMR
ncbi:ABC transporter permease [Paenibacillus sp. MER 180]|uniref:ABC transporter permease n=1 Tax=Paenibacillus sp. MER 180 TaxID=2939570 RepID=UPI0020407C21|nr:ABC transporter permease [Paenibacillus sp. MER 180]MCM3292470.1 ABC transporter permease [Paenibacillus sp. MER 180]